MKNLPASLLGLTLILIAPQGVSGADVVLHYSAIEKILLQEVFNQEGKHFLFGGPEFPCMSAYLSQPVISSVGMRLKLQAFFKGSMGQKYADKCLGVSEEFPLAMTGRPHFQDGTLILKDVRYSDESQIPQFSENLSAFVNHELQDAFKYDLTRAVESLIVENQNLVPYDLELSSLDIPQIAVLEDRLALQVEFSILLR